MKEPLGDVFKRYRLRAGLTQAQAAELLRIDQSYLSKLERSRRVLNDLALLTRIATVLAVPPHEVGLSDELLASAKVRVPAQGGPSMADAVTGQVTFVAASQDRWRKERRYLNQHRSDLAHRVIALYPGSERLGPTTLISLAGWSPSEPVDLSAIELAWREGAQRIEVHGDEPEVRTILPFYAPGHQFDRYTSAIRYLDPPTLFENRPSYRIMSVHWGQRHGTLEFGLSTYFDKLDLSEALGHEYAAGSMNQPQRVLSWTDLPFRSLVGDPFDCHRRAVIPAVTTLTIRVDPEGASFLLHWRDPAKVATAGGMYDVIPAGEFQPSSVTFWDQSNDFDIWRNIVRELSEELLGMPEHDGSRSTPIDYDSWPFYRELEQARNVGDLYVGCMGVGLDALTLAATILTVIVIRGDVFDRIFGDIVSTNSEGHVVSASGVAAQGIPFNPTNVTRLLTTEPLASPGAACLHLAWEHRRFLLDQIHPRTDGGNSHER